MSPKSSHVRDLERMLSNPAHTFQDIVLVIGYALDLLPPAVQKVASEREKFHFRVREATAKKLANPSDPSAQNWSVRKHTAVLMKADRFCRRLHSLLQRAVDCAKKRDREIAYAKQLLTASSNLNPTDIPSLLAEAKMLQVKIQRRINK